MSVLIKLLSSVNVHWPHFIFYIKRKHKNICIKQQSQILSHPITSLKMMSSPGTAAERVIGHTEYNLCFIFCFYVIFPFLLPLILSHCLFVPIRLHLSVCVCVCINLPDRNIDKIKTREASLSSSPPLFLSPPPPPSWWIIKLTEQ